MNKNGNGFVFKNKNNNFAVNEKQTETDIDGIPNAC